MRASSITSSAIFASLSLAEVLAPSPAISDPTITPAPNVPVELLRKQNNDRFMGWVKISGTWTSRTCDIGGTYYQSGSNWRCCATTVAGCQGPVGCVSGSLVYSVTTGSQSRATYACTDVYTSAEDQSFTICNTGFMYENTADASALTNVFCGISSVNWSYYRAKPSDSTSSTSSTSSSTPTITSTSSSTSPTPTSIGQLTKTKKKSSKAWIAGAVIGPLVGLALLGALLWFFLGRKKKDTTPPPQQPPMQQGPPAPYPAPAYPGSPNPPPAQYFDPMGQKQPDMAPYGVASHNSWVPQTPVTQASQSPQPPPASPYGPPPGQQQWTPVQQNQVYNQPPPGSPPPPAQSPAPQNLQPYPAEANKQPIVGERPFSAELDANVNPPMAQYVQPSQQQLR